MEESENLHEALADAAESPTAWFVVLERARHVGDFEKAAEAQRQLKRLGVIVRFESARKAVRRDR
jgi:hypothetical protein